MKMIFKYLTNKSMMYNNLPFLSYVRNSSRSLYHTTKVQSESVHENFLFNITESIKKRKGEYESSKQKNIIKPIKHKARKKLVINWSSGTEKAQEAANHIIKSIFKVNSDGLIKAVNTHENKVNTMNIRDFARGLDLTKHGLVLLRVEDYNGIKIPMVKIIDSRIALKNYSNKLAKQKEEELLRLGVSQNRVGRGSTYNNKVDSDTKNIKISWQISDADLSNQKFNDISSQLKKGFKVNLHLIHKDSNNMTPINVTGQEITTSRLSDKNLKRRIELVEKLEEIVSEFSSQILKEGSIEKRMIIKVLPNVKLGEQLDKKALKNERKKERQERLKDRIERKKQKETEDMNL